jgi:hypothetical protein
MGEPRDRVNDWLNAEVEPLAPPPGTFERISRRARRRKARRAAISAAGVAVVISVAAATPGIVSTLRGPGRSAPPVAANSPRATAQPTVTGQGTGGVAAQSSSPVRQSAPASLLNRGSPVPLNFQPTSVTFIGPHTGAVIGQAGTPGQCASPYCTSLAGTTDYGQKWFGVSAPHTGPPQGAGGVGQLRFLNNQDGWAFGPQLWVTHDGGGTWTQEQTYGMRVTDLETADGHAFALFATCTGTGSGFGSDCASFSLYTSPGGSDQWRRVPGPTSDLAQAAGQPGSASLVISGQRGYLLAPSGELFSGPLTGGAWTTADAQAPCAPGAPDPDGQPTGALLAAGSQAQLVLVCNAGTNAAGDSQPKTVMQSSDGGTSWSTAGNGPSSAGAATSVAAHGNVVVLATNSGLYLSGNGGTSWQQVQPGPQDAAAGQPGFTYVGMTSATNGVALPADPHLHELYITTDGGSTWHAQAISAP